jgi:predicted N-acyltransferase
MIITYSWLDQYKQIGMNTYPDLFGTIEFVIPVTPASRTVIIYNENRTVVIAQ